MTDTSLKRAAGSAGIRSAVQTIRAAQGRARQFWRVFDTSLVPMALVDNDRRYLAANAAARLMVRLSSDEVRIRRMEDFTPPHMVGRLHEIWTRLMRVGEVCGRFDVGLPDGSEIQIVYCTLANVLPAQHLVVFMPANWPEDEFTTLEMRAPRSGQCRLSPREREVLSLIAAGAGTEQIAQELTISVATARTHTRNALRKLGAQNRAHAIALAIRDGLIDVPGWTEDRTPSYG